MNANDIMNSLSGIDPKYIDEAAYELHDANAADTHAADDKTSRPAKVTDIASRTRIKKMFYIVLPSVAAILLIVAVALPAVLRVSKNESAAMAESAAPAEYETAAEAAPEAAEETAEEAASDEYYPDMASEAEAPAAEEEAAEAPSEPAAEAAEEATETAGPVSENTYSDSANKTANASQSLRADQSKDAAAEPVSLWVISDSEYDKGILKLYVAGHVPEDMGDLDCTITALAAGGKEETVSEGRLADLADKVDMTADMVTLDISSAKLAAGSYRITIGNVSADFTAE